VSPGQTPRRHLPAQLSAPLRSFLGTEAGSAGVMLLAAAVALGWANSPWSGSYEALWDTHLSVSLGDAELAMDLGHWVNDGLMALFFFVIGLEVRREPSLGELTRRSRLVIPLLAGVPGALARHRPYLVVRRPGAAARRGVIGTRPG